MVFSSAVAASLCRGACGPWRKRSERRQSVVATAGGRFQSLGGKNQRKDEPGGKFALSLLLLILLLIVSLWLGDQDHEQDQEQDQEQKGGGGLCFAGRPL